MAMIDSKAPPQKFAIGPILYYFSGLHIVTPLFRKISFNSA